MPKARGQGILVTNIEEALPYFTLQQPLSSEGIGLLVLDHLDARLPANHSIVRVPAICRATSEPIIAMAALLQLGSQPVVRNMTTECVEVQESPPVPHCTKIKRKYRGKQFAKGR